MKVNLRIIIGILCGVAMISCTSTVSEPNTSQIPIQFGTSVSRAAVNSASDMTAFSVWGGYDNVKLFEGTKVNNTGSGWTYEFLCRSSCIPCRWTSSKCSLGWHNLRHKLRLFEDRSRSKRPYDCAKNRNNI